MQSFSGRIGKHPQDIALRFLQPLRNAFGARREIEDCLIKHPAVALAAAVGKPDPVRTEIVKAFVTLKPGYMPSDALAAEIQAFVRTRLSAHEYPREVAFVDQMPMTTTGKVIRRALREQA